MARCGRPRKQQENRFVMRLTLHLWGGEDDDLIAFFKEIPARRRVAMVKSALRNGESILVSPSIGADDELVLAEMVADFLV